MDQRILPFRHRLDGVVNKISRIRVRTEELNTAGIMSHPYMMELRIYVIYGEWYVPMVAGASTMISWPFGTGLFAGCTTNRMRVIQMALFGPIVLFWVLYTPIYIIEDLGRH